jgi:hypothetical protein
MAPDWDACLPHKTDNQVHPSWFRKKEESHTQMWSFEATCKALIRAYCWFQNHLGRTGETVKQLFTPDLDWNK